MTWLRFYGKEVAMLGFEPKQLISVCLWVSHNTTSSASQQLVSDPGKQ